MDDDGFFTRAELVKSRRPLMMVPMCGSCGIYKQVRSPQMPVWGDGGRGILIVGEAPGQEEDAQGRPFIGNAGQRLLQPVRRAGIDLRRDCWVMNALSCRPTKDGKNRAPTVKEVDWCRPKVVEAIKRLEPKVILILGGVPLTSVMPYVYKEKVGSITKWAGWQIPSQKVNAWICPTFHPAATLYDDSPVLNNLFDEHVTKAVTLEDRPWDEIPDYESRVRCIFDDERAARMIRSFIGTRPVAFDYETTTLKPDGPYAQIVCCSVSDGDRTVSYMWTKEARRATQELIQSPTPKVGANAKFETRHTLKEFGHGVTNWVWDTVLAAHVLDNRQSVTGVKFQAFVRLGVDEWDGHIKWALKSKTGCGNEPNRIKELPPDELLRYCGIDATVEMLVAKHQRKELRDSICV